MYQDGSVSEIVTGEYTIGDYQLDLDNNGGSDPNNHLVDNNYDYNEVVTLPTEVPETATSRETPSQCKTLMKPCMRFGTTSMFRQ